MTSPEPVESPAVQPPAEKEDKEASPATTTDATPDNAGSDTMKEPSTELTPEEQDTEKTENAEATGGVKEAAEDANEENPPLPPGPPPGQTEEEDDGWQPIWDPTYGSYYFYNSKTGETTWTNPRVPEATNVPLVAAEAGSPDGSTAAAAAYHDPLQYNPAIHGDYDPTAPYAQPRETQETAPVDYTATAAFNRFTGKFTPSFSHKVPENYNDENKSKRQMEFYFDVDAAANSHDGKSLKAERQTRKLTKKELKAFKEKRRARKEEKRKAWLKD
jgi:hypothetical protein